MPANDLTSTKRNRISHTCDVCLRRKTYCDGSNFPGHRCSTCLAADLKCTYTESVMKREAKKDYVRALEERLGRMEALLLEIHQNTQLRESQAQVAMSVRSSQTASYTPFITKSMFAVNCNPLHVVPDCSKHNEDTGFESDDDDSFADVNYLSDYLAELKFDPFAARFMGESSGTNLLKNLLEPKSMHRRHESPNSAQMSTKVSPAKDVAMKRSSVFSNKRPEYWEMQDWERKSFGSDKSSELKCTYYVYPDPDLLGTLVHHYFDEWNSMMPLLHRPSFEAGILEGLHLRDDGFARVLLLVCAVGSGYVDDPRVISDPGSGLQSGWKWFIQVTLGGLALLALPSLYDLQVCCLASVFLQCSSTPHIYWTLMGTGIRIAQEIGIHRRKAYRGLPNAYDEQWKRAFWTLVVLDRCTSWFLGRPGAIRDEDVDLDLPLEVDDEYWDLPDPSQYFQQPPGKPAQVSVFVQMIKLTQILALSQRTIYASKRTKHILRAAEPNWEEKSVSQLNLALSRWMNSLPSHLRWNASEPNILWFHQSAFLYTSYYTTQLTIYRPFLPDKLQKFDLSTDVGKISTNKPHVLTAPALAVCTSAARACAQVVYKHATRTGIRAPMHIGGAFHSGAFILLNVLTSQKLGNRNSIETSSDMQLVENCINVLRACENAWPLAGKFRDLLNQVASTQSSTSKTSWSYEKPDGGSEQVLEEELPTLPSPSFSAVKKDFIHDAGSAIVTEWFPESLSSSIDHSIQMLEGETVSSTTNTSFEQLLLELGVEYQSGQH